MLDDFFTRAIIAGIGVALIAGPFGCFVVWRRMAYFGDTLAHSALLGVALAFFFQFNLLVSVFLVCAVISLLLLLLQRNATLSSDALLGLLSHSALALGLVLVSFMAWMRIDLMSFLLGDILAVSRGDILAIYAGGLFSAATLIWMWRPLLAETVNRELAEAEGLHPERAKIVFMLMLALIIAISMKIVGILLITALMIIPAATARRLSATPEAMALLASLIGAVAVVGGMLGSLRFDTPSGPSIVVASLVIFIVVIATTSAFAYGRSRAHINPQKEVADG